MLSRVADTLFWMSRYVERAENTARMLDVNLQVTLDSERGRPELNRIAWEPILAARAEIPKFTETYSAVNSESVCDYVTFARDNPNSIWSCIANAREGARTVREYISSEMWERLNAFWLWINAAESRESYNSSGINFYRSIVDYSHQFQGTTDATLTHGDGWNYMHAGRFLERADNTSRILDLKYHILLPNEERVGGSVDVIQWQAVLKSCSAFEAYRKVHIGRVHPSSVAEFIVLHDRFPRSIRFCVDAVDTALHRISGCDRAHFSTKAERLAGRLCGELNYATIEEILRRGLHEYLDEIQLRLIEISKGINADCFPKSEPIPQRQNQSQG